jgi:adenylate cyclase
MGFLNLKKKVTIRVSIIGLITLLILITSVTILSVSAGFYRNSINWVIEVLTQKMTHSLQVQLIRETESGMDVGKVRAVLDNFHVSENGKVFLLDKNEKILAASERIAGDVVPSRFHEGEHYIGLVEDPLIVESFEKYLSNERKKNRSVLKRKFDHFDYWYEFRKYTAIYTKVKLANKDYLAVILYPYKDFFSSFTRNNIILFSLVLFFVVLALYISMQLSKRISVPLTKLAEDTLKIKDLDLSSESVIKSSLIEVEKMSEAINNMKSGLRSFQKYVPADLVRQLIQLHHEASLGGVKKEVTIFFADIAGFTSVSEALTAEKLVEWLGEYLAAVTGTLVKHNATVDKYIGDAVMAFWNAPLEDNSHAQNACLAALAFQQKLEELRKKSANASMANTYSRIGINTGEVVVGNIGYENRMDYTVIGDAVNLASRLEAMNKMYDTWIMLGEATKNQVGDKFELRQLDRVAVKGKTQGVNIYELLGVRGAVPVELLAARDQYEKALNHYFNREFQVAITGFEELLKAGPENKAALVLLSRSEELINQGLTKDWDGVYIAKEK